MNVTRRNILKLAGGSVLGLLFTPVPWKLLDDSAIWTQNWSLIPPLPRGSINFRYSTCTLCPGGCAIKARCIANVPVSVTGVPNHPISSGVLCPMGLGGHHLAYHPLRVVRPMKFDGSTPGSKLIPVSYDEAISHIANVMSSAKSGESVALLDQRPGRMISDVFREFLSALPNGLYLIPPARECATTTRLQEMTGVDNALGFDFEHTRTVLSFGAPLLDGWGTPGRMVQVFAERKAKTLKLIQVESYQSRTALQADRWLPVRPGTEAALALGIANVILSEGLYPRKVEKYATDFTLYKELVAEFTPEVVAAQTGLTKQDIIAAAQELALNGPAIVIAGCNPGGGPLGRSAETAIAGLNLLLGSVGQRGGVVTRREIPGSRKPRLASHQLHEVHDHSIRTLIIDGEESGYTFPWALVEKKLAESAVVVSLSPYLGGFAAHADYLLPSPAHLESLQEVPNPENASSSTCSISQPLLPAPEGTNEPVEFISKLAKAAGVSGAGVSSTVDLLKERVSAIHASKRGVVFSPSDGTTKRVVDGGSADGLWGILNNGGVWIDDEMDQAAPRHFCLLGASAENQKNLQAATSNTATPLVLVPVGWRGAVEGASMSPMMSKLYQESELRSLPGHASINPETGTAHHLIDGEKAMLRTQSSAMEVLVHIDPSVMPGVILVAIGPGPNGRETPLHFNSDGVLTLCDITAEGTWNVTPVTIGKV